MKTKYIIILNIDDYKRLEPKIRGRVIWANPQTINKKGIVKITGDSKTIKIIKDLELKYFKNKGLF